MKLITILFVIHITQSIAAVESQISRTFQQRFGPNSFIFNEPLYFHQPSKKKTESKPTKNYRKTIQKQLRTSNDTSRKKRSSMPLNPKHKNP